LSHIIYLTQPYSPTAAFTPRALVKSASHYSRVRTLAVVAVAEGAGLRRGAQGVVIVEGIGAEVALGTVSNKILLE